MSHLFAGYELPKAKKGISERGELLNYFFEKAEVEWSGAKALKLPYVAFKLSHLTLLDLYAFKSMCEDRVRNGYPWGKFFWGSLKEQTWQRAGIDS